HSGHAADATLLVSPSPSSGRYGRVVLAADGRVAGFNEKQSDMAGLVSAGVYLLKSEVIESLPAGQSLSMEYDILHRMIGGRLYGMEVPGPVVDIGTPE